MYSVPCQEHLFQLLCFLMGMSPFYFVLPSLFTMKIEKQLQNQKLYYDACIVQTVRNLIHPFEVPELLKQSQQQTNERRSIRECERETDYWENILPSPHPGWAQPTINLHDREDSPSHLHLGEHNNQNDGGQWRQVPAWRSGQCAASQGPTFPDALHW